MENPQSKKPSLKSRLALALKPKSRGNRLTKASSHIYNSGIESQRIPAKSPHDSPMEESKPGPIDFYNTKTTTVNTDTGELWDEGEMLHSMLRRDSMDSVNSITRREVQARVTADPSRKPGEAMIVSLPAGIWEVIKNHLNPTDAANLAISSKTLLALIGGRSFGALNIYENHQFKLDFLLPMDKHLPDHLLCFPCATYHIRIQKGTERLKANDVLNPLLTCPNSALQSRHRLTPHHSLPFTFLQLVLRAELYGPQYGIPLTSLDRRYKSRDSEWTHQTRYFMHRTHLLLRVVSKCFAPAGLPPAGQRHFLFSREDYTPYFSVCTHWRDGLLMPLCKCALSHIPVPSTSQLQSLSLARPSIFVTLCQDCRPMRRCPECPTEYLIEVKLSEDRAEPDPGRRFKQALVVTRWSDLGGGQDPGKGEWAVCNGQETYDSFAHLGRRAISGVFESQNGAMSGQRIMNLNPRGEKKGEAGHDWY